MSEVSRQQIDQLRQENESLLVAINSLQNQRNLLQNNFNELHARFMLLQEQLNSGYDDSLTEEQMMKLKDAEILNWSLIKDQVRKITDVHSDENGNYDLWKVTKAVILFEIDRFLYKKDHFKKYTDKDRFYIKWRKNYPKASLRHNLLFMIKQLLIHAGARDSKLYEFLFHAGGADYCSTVRLLVDTAFWGQLRVVSTTNNVVYIDRILEPSAALLPKQAIRSCVDAINFRKQTVGENRRIRLIAWKVMNDFPMMTTDLLQCEPSLTSKEEEALFNEFNDKTFVFPEVSSASIPVEDESDTTDESSGSASPVPSEHKKKKQKCNDSYEDRGDKTVIDSIIGWWTSMVFAFAAGCLLILMMM